MICPRRGWRHSTSCPTRGQRLRRGTPCRIRCGCRRHRRRRAHRRSSRRGTCRQTRIGTVLRWLRGCQLMAIRCRGRQHSSSSAPHRPDSGAGGTGGTAGGGKSTTHHTVARAPVPWQPVATARWPWPQRWQRRNGWGLCPGHSGRSDACDTRCGGRRNCSQSPCTDRQLLRRHVGEARASDQPQASRINYESCCFVISTAWKIPTLLLKGEYVPLPTDM